MHQAPVPPIAPPFGHQQGYPQPPFPGPTGPFMPTGPPGPFAPPGPMQPPPYGPFHGTPAHHPFQVPHGFAPGLQPQQMANMLFSAVQQSAKSSDLKVKEFKKADRNTYSEWLCTLLRQLHGHSKFKAFVTFTPGHGLLLSPGLPADESTTLFIALCKAIDTKILANIGIHDKSAPDGIDLLRRLDREYGLVIHNPLETTNAVTKFNALARNSSEDIANYHTRYMVAYQTCIANNNLPLRDIQQLRVHYLRSLKHPVIDKVIMDVVTMSPVAAKFTACATLEQLRETVKEHVDMYTTLFPSSAHSGTNSGKPSPTDSASSPVAQRVKRLNSYIDSHSDKDIIGHLAKQMSLSRGGCILHDTQDHKYHTCKTLKKILHRHKKQSCLETAIKRSEATKDTPTPTIKAKRTAKKGPSKAAFNKQQEELDECKRIITKQEKTMQDIISAFRATAAAQASNPLATANAFAALALSHDSSEESELEGFESDHEHDEDDEQDDDEEDNSTVISNTNESYSAVSSLSSSSSPHSLPLSPSPFAQCKRGSTTASPSTASVVDSGSTHHMHPTATDFEYLLPLSTTDGAPPMVQLGKETVQLPIKGIGPIRRRLPNGEIIRQFELCVPGLTCPLYSVSQHMASLGCSFHAENKEALLAYPNFTLSLTTEPEITFKSTIISPSSTTPNSFDEETAIPCSTPHRIDAHVIVPSYAHRDFTRPQLEKLSRKVAIRFPSSTPLTSVSPSMSGPTFDRFIPCPSTITIPPKSSTTVPTGMSFTLPPGHSVDISSITSPSFEVQSASVTDSTAPPLRLQVRNPHSTPTTIKAGTILATFSITNGTTPLLILPTDSEDSSSTTRQQPHSFRHPSRRFQVFHTSNGAILVDNKKPNRPRAFRINRPVSSGVRHPHLPPHPDTISQWTLHNLHDDEASDESPILQQRVPSTTPKQPFTSTSPSPHVQPNSRVNASTKKHVHVTIDELSQSIGFLKPDRLLRKLDILGSGNFTVSGLSRNPKLDPGESASINATRRNTSPSTPPPAYSDVWHCDIGYGPCTAHGGIKYTLLFVDKQSRYKRIYPLKNLTTSLLRAFKRFFKDCTTKPKIIRTDFDNKILSGEVAKFVEETQQVQLEAAPPYRQHQNGLVERAWQTAVDMTRNWLTSSLLPTKYWWFGMKRAIEVLNIMPTTHLKHQLSTPHELVYGKKADYRTLFPMFSVAYLKQEREQGGHHKNKFRSRTLKCIVIGSDPKSDGLQFYHPSSKQVLTGGNGYRLDPHLPSGPQFHETYDGTFTFNTHADMDCIHKPLAHDDNNTVFFKDPANPTSFLKGVVVSQPLDDDKEPYTVQATVSGALHEFMASDLHESDPSTTPSDDPAPNVPFPLHPWIKPDSKVTLYLPSSMQRPKQGFLRRDSSGEWSFSPGRSGNHTPIPLLHFDQLAPSLLTHKKLFRGWKTAKSVITARHVRATSNILARHVSAATLHVHEAPSLLRHHLLHPHDRKLWDAAYLEEIDGLLKLNTWEVISEEDYRRLRHVTGKALPTMAISKIKKDEKGNPQRCKYRIVVLGNLDSHNWDKSDCFAPVLSQPEMRLLVSIATDMKRIPKSGDVSQAFCQGVLPPTEQYVIRPPPGCPYTPKNSYWKLLRTLYGLKRSPRHWYEKARKILLSLGLKPIKNSTCMFKGIIKKGHPPLYIGLYVDDFIYFSESDYVEQLFEEKFGSEVSTTFEGDVSHFLGIAFQSIRHPDNHVSTHLSQEASIDSLLAEANLTGPEVATVPTPYRSGYPVDKIAHQDLDPTTQARYNLKLQKVTGSFQWLATATRPDIATITNLLSQYNHKAQKGHLDAAKRVLRYLKGTKTLGISFHSRRNASLSSFIKFPLSPNTVTPFTDANWGPQDQSKPKPNNPPVELFKSRSISGFIIWLNGPIHWSSRRQTITARSTAESEIYATDECVKYLQHLYHILQEMDLHHKYMPRPTVVYNDNAACVAWSHNHSTKGLRHIQIRENAVREQVQLKNIAVRHIQGAINLSDLFTKEDKDTFHFILIRNFILESFSKFAVVQDPSSNLSA